MEETSKGNKAEALKLSKRTVSFSAEETFLAVKCLDVMGLEYYLSQSESDKVLAYLAFNSSNSYCVTSDTDVLPHGSPNMLIRADKHDKFEYLAKEDILKCLDVSHEQFIRLCVLSGTDYNESIKGLGWKTTLSLVKKYSNLRDVCLHYSADTGLDYLENIEKIETVFSDNSSIEFEKVEGRSTVDFEMFNKEFVEEKRFAEKRLENLMKSLQAIEGFKNKQ